MTAIVKPTAARSKRATRAVEAKRTASECIGPIERDMSLFAVTRGQFSMIDCIQHSLSEMGPSKLTIWTWAIADYEIETFEWLLRAGSITQALLVIDQAGEKRIGQTAEHDKVGGLMGRWLDRFGERSMKVCLNHAKIATLDNGTLKVLIRGSMNLNMNPRFEQLDITEGGPAFDLIREIENSLPFLSRGYNRTQLEEATGIRSLFTDEQLRPFQTQKLKVWAK